LLYGLGRKITLRPIVKFNSIINFEEKLTFIEEGQFIKDYFDNSFGRRVYLSGKFRIGWWLNSEEGLILHGYGQDTNLDQLGFF